MKRGADVWTLVFFILACVTGNIICRLLFG